MQTTNRADGPNSSFRYVSPLRSRWRPSRIPHNLEHEHLPSQHALIHPTLTRYQLTVILLIASFGLSKAAYAYLGYSAVPTTLEWISGVVISLSLYWLGLYEPDPPPSIAWIFQDVDAEFMKSCFAYGVFMLLISIWPILCVAPSTGVVILLVSTDFPDHHPTQFTLLYGIAFILGILVATAICVQAARRWPPLVWIKDRVGLPF